MSPGKVLIVEDEAITAMELTKRIGEWGFDVIGDVSSGQQAREMIHKYPVDIILMDINLKGNMDGIDTAREILKTQDVLIIFLTAHGNPKTIEKAKKAQPFYYIIKPFRENELKFALESGFENHKLIKKLKKQKKSYCDLAENIPGIVYRIKVKNDWHMDFYNDMLPQITGYTPEELMNGDICSMDSIIVEEDRPKLINIVGQAIKNGDSFKVNYRIRDKEGMIKILEEKARPTYNENGEVETVEGVIFELNK